MIIFNRDSKSQKIVYFAHQKKKKLMRKKTYFIGVTHEIDGIVNYSIEFFSGCKISISYFIKKPNHWIGLLSFKNFTLLRLKLESWCYLKHLEQNFPKLVFGNLYGHANQSQSNQNLSLLRLSKYHLKKFHLG